MWLKRAAGWPVAMLLASTVESADAEKRVAPSGLKHTALQESACALAERTCATCLPQLNPALASCSVSALCMLHMMTGALLQTHLLACGALHCICAHHAVHQAEYQQATCCWAEGHVLQAGRWLVPPADSEQRYSALRHTMASAGRQTEPGGISVQECSFALPSKFRRRLYSAQARYHDPWSTRSSFEAFPKRGKTVCPGMDSRWSFEMTHSCSEVLASAWP